MISKAPYLTRKPRPHVAAKIPHEVHAELIQFKESTGKTESQILNEALASYLGIEAQATVPDRLSNIESQLDQQVEQRFEKLEQQVEIILEKFTRLATR